MKESDKQIDPEMDDERMQFLEREHSDIFSIELMYSRKFKPEMPHTLANHTAAVRHLCLAAALLHLVCVQSSLMSRFISRAMLAGSAS